jgi:hypothetical protein
VTGIDRREVFRTEANARHHVGNLLNLQVLALGLGYRVALDLLPLETQPAEAMFDEQGNWRGVPQPDYVDDVMVREELAKLPHEIDLPMLARQLADRSVNDLVEDFDLTEEEAKDLFRKMGVTPKRIRGLPPMKKGCAEDPDF